LEQVLPKKEAQITREFLAAKGKKAVVYGSVAQKTQVKQATKIRMRPSGDIDIAVKHPQSIAVEYATKLYETTGIKPKIPMKALARGGWGPGEEATVFVKGKAVTFHTFHQLKGSPFYLGKPRKTPGGVYVQRIEEQLGRKVAGYYIRGRAKDLPDYKRITKDVQSQLRKEKPFRISKKLAEARIKGLEKVSKVWGEPTKPTKLPTKLPAKPYYTAPVTSTYYPIKDVSGYYAAKKPTPSIPYDYPVPKADLYPAAPYKKAKGGYVPPSPAYPTPPYQAPSYPPPTPSYQPPSYQPPSSPTYPTPPYQPPVYPPTPPYKPPVYPPTPPYKPPTTPPTYPLFVPSFKPRKRRVKVLPSRVTRVYKYQPTITAVVKGIRGERPRVLTGIGLRPIPKKYKVKI